MEGGEIVPSDCAVGKYRRSDGNVDTRQRDIKHVVKTEHLPPQADDIDGAEQNEKEGQLDPR